MKTDNIAMAEDALASFNFGDDIEIVGQDGWDTTDPRDLTKIVYAQALDADPESDSEKISFHVRFHENGALDEVYALAMRTGSEVGEPGIAKKSAPDVTYEQKADLANIVQREHAILTDASKSDGFSIDAIMLNDGEEGFSASFQVDAGRETLVFVYSMGYDDELQGFAPYAEATSLTTEFNVKKISTSKPESGQDAIQVSLDNLKSLASEIRVEAFQWLQTQFEKSAQARQTG